MKRLILFLLLFAAIKVAGQTTGYLRFDTVKIMKQNGTCELYIINKTKDTLGILTNVGGGLTQFRKSRVLNDSTIVVGLDTLVIIGGAGGGGGSGSVTSISQGYGIINTPNPITSTGIIRADTSGTNGLVTRTELLDSTDITTQVESPIYVKLRSSWPVPDTLAIDTTLSTTRAWLYKVADSLIGLMATAGVANTNLGSHFRWLVPSSQGIKGPANSSTITWDSTSNANSLTAKVDTAAIATPNFVNNSGRTYPDESRNEIVLLEQSAWTAADLGAQFQRGSNHTLTLNGSFPRIASSTIVWGGNSLTRFLPNLPTIAIYDKIEVDYQIVSALASNVGFGPSMYSNNVNGANFGYTTYLAVSTSTATPHFAKQDGTSDQTAATFTVSQNDVIRQTIEFNDTVAIATFQNLTTSSVVRTITKSFVAGTAPYPPNTGTWGFQNFSGTYEIRRVKITTRKTMSPTLMVAFDSKGQIVASPWVARFPSLLNSRYPTVLNYSGGGDQLKDLIDKKIEFSRINPEQVLIGLGSNDLRYGSSLTTTLDRLARVVRMVSGSTTRWAVTVVPEDSTAGGLSGLTALKNNMAASYPNNYIDLWTFMSTSNVLKAAYNSGDGVHPNTEGHRIMDSLIAASGFFSVQSPNRRSPYQKFGGGVWATGDSLYGPFKTPLPINAVLRMNDSNQVAHSLLFDNGTKMTMSANYPSVQTVSVTTLFHMDGLQAYTGPNGGNLFYDRTTTSNFHTIYSNNNFLRYGYNGTDNIMFSSIGEVKIGNGGSPGEILGMLQVKKNRTLASGLGRLGVNLNIDTTTTTMPSSGNAFFAGNSIGPHTVTAASSGNSTLAANLYIADSVVAGTNYIIPKSYAVYINNGRFRLGTVDSTTSATGGFLYKDFATGDVKMTAAPGGGGITSINSETGPAITLTAANGLTRTTTTNNVEYKLGGTLSETTQIDGASNTLNLGQGASPLGSFSVTTSGQLSLSGALQIKSESATDANYTSTSTPMYIRLPDITAGRTVTINLSDGAGKIVIIWNENSSGNNWSFTNTVFDAAGTTITNLTNDTVYILLNTGSGWLRIN